MPHKCFDPSEALSVGASETTARHQSDLSSSAQSQAPTGGRATGHPAATRTGSSDPDHLRIAVIGGSLVGAVTALLLRERGFHNITVCEATPAGVPRVGGLIALEHSSLDVLDRLGIDQDEFITNQSESIMQATVTNTVSGPPVRRIYPGRNTTWNPLHSALLRHLPSGIIRTDVRLRELTHDGGRPVLQMADGTCEQADLIVFADGRNSTGRRLLDPGRTLSYAGYVAHRGQAPLPSRSEHFERFDAPHSAQFNIAPISGGVDWTFYLNADAQEYTDLFGASPARRPFALPQHVSARARTTVDASARRYLPAEQAHVVESTATRSAVPIMDIDAPEQMVWTVGTGFAVLIGDALAPPRPHTARGANNGIEQAEGLLVALTQHQRFGADLSAALRGWQARHLPTVRAALDAGPRIGQRLGLGHRLPDATDVVARVSAGNGPGA